MVKATIFASLLFASFVLDGHTQQAEACGVKLRANAPRIARTKASTNPSKILVVGSRDSGLLKQLREAKHSVHYASTVDDARNSKYQLVISDADQMDDARDRFKTAKVVKKRSSHRDTAKNVELALSRSATSRSTDGRTAVASNTPSRTPVLTGQEGGVAVKSTPVETGTERPTATTTPPTRVATVTKPAPKPVAEKVERPKPAPVAEKPVEKTRTARTDSKPAPKASGKWVRSFQFGTNKTALNGGAERRLRRNGEWLLANPGSSVTIEGHTDSVGEESYNLDLSERRANVARDYLLGMGIEDSRINVVPKGESEPAFKPSTSGRNRRIVLIKE